jgi:acetyl-CoA carboxylase carboxyltransferase component
MDTIERLEYLKKLRAEAKLGGGQKRIDKLHSLGSMTARERIELLLDKGSFEEFDMFKTHRCTDFGMENQKIPGDGVVTGHGTIDGRIVYVFAQDFTVLGGSLSETFAEKICKIMDLAMKNGAPVIGLNDSGGARIQEGIESLAGYTDIFLRNVMSSGVVPQISAIFGPCAGGAVYSPALTDFVVMVKNNSYMFLTGPKVVKSVTHEDVTSKNSGAPTCIHRAAAFLTMPQNQGADAIAYMRKLVSFLPQNNMENPPVINCSDPVERTADALSTQRSYPANPNEAYDMKEIILQTVDHGDFFEIKETFCPQHHCRVCPLQRYERRHRGQPAGPLLRRTGHRLLGQRSPVCQVLRLFQHSGGNLRRRARLSAGNRSGIRRRHP